MRKILTIILIVFSIILISAAIFWLSTEYKSIFNTFIEDDDTQVKEENTSYNQAESEIISSINLKILSYIDLNTPGYDLIVEEDLAFIGKNYEVEVISVKDKKNPVRINSIKDVAWRREKGWAINLAKDENNLYIGENYKLNIVNIEDINNPVFISDLALDGFDQRIKPGKNYLYIATSIPSDEVSENTNLYIVDITDLYDPKIVVKAKIKDSFYCMDKKDNHVYLAGKGRFVVFDITDRDNLFVEKEIKINGWGNDIFIQDNNIYMVGNEGLTIINLSRSGSPEIIKILDLGGYGEKVFLSGDYAYILCNKENSNGNLIIVDINNKNNPVIIYDIPVEGIPGQIFVDKKHIYMTSTDIYDYPDGGEQVKYIYGRFYIIENITS